MHRCKIACLLVGLQVILLVLQRNYHHLYQCHVILTRLPDHQHHKLEPLVKDIIRCTNLDSGLESDAKSQSTEQPS